MNAADSVAQATPRIPGIDGLRAAAILIVMVAHAGLERIVPGGFGVTIFFFLSGYLITTLLRVEFINTAKIDLKSFYIRRSLRILPPLFLSLAFTVAAALAGILPIMLSPNGLVVDALFLTNYAPQLGVHSTTPIPLWSLDVEEHFYLLFPAFFLLIARRRPIEQAKILMTLCLAFLLARVGSVALGFTTDVYYWSHTRMDSIIFGCILALWHNPVLDRAAWRPNRTHVAIAVGVIFLTFAIRSEAFRYSLRFTMQGGALFVLFSAAIHTTGMASRMLASRPLKIVALLSYTLYLIHMPMLRIFEGMAGAFSFVPAYIAAFLFAGALYLAVERPIARTRKRMLAASTKRPPAPQARNI